MDFEYGCSTTNKFCFLDENEVEDPSELLAQATKETATSKDAKTGKDAKAKPKSADAKGKPVAGGKDAKKQPLQQQTDNSVKKSDLPKDAKKPGQAKQTVQTPREDKENTSNRQSSGQGQRTGEQQQRRPRPEGQPGDAPRRDNQDRPPRRTGPRPERPPRRPRPEEGTEGAMVTDDNVANLEGGETGFRRQGNSAGGFRGPRTGGGERRPGPGGFRNGPGGFRQRRSNDPDHPREFDRHSGSEKTGVKAVDKKDGAGKGNWGTATDELAVEGEVLNETQEQPTENQNWAERVDESEEKGGEDAEDKEQHPNFMTLDEYKALKNQVNKKNDFNIRKPGEGEDMSKWGKTYVLPKKPVDEEDEEEVEEENEEDVEEENEEDEKKKNLLSQIQIKFYDSGSDRRGDRRGERQGGDRRGGAPRPRPPRPQGETTAAPTTTTTTTTTATTSTGETSLPPQETTVNPTNDNETSSPQGKPRFNRPGGQQRGNTNQRRGPREGGPRMGNQKAPKFDDEKDFPSLGK